MENKFYEFVLEERTRLENKFSPDYQDNNGLGKNFIVKCNGNSSAVLSMAIRVLLIINHRYDVDGTLCKDGLADELPYSFIEKFKREKTGEEINKFEKWWFSLSYKNKVSHIQKSINDPWEFSNWIYWFEREDRLWFWWGGEILDDNYFVFTVKTIDELFLTGALRWLFIASGAIDILDADEFL